MSLTCGRTRSLSYREELECVITFRMKLKCCHIIKIKKMEQSTEHRNWSWSVDNLWARLGVCVWVTLIKIFVGLFIYSDTIREICENFLMKSQRKWCRIGIHWLTHQEKHFSFFFFFYLRSNLGNEIVTSIADFINTIKIY